MTSYRAILNPPPRKKATPVHRLRVVGDGDSGEDEMEKTGSASGSRRPILIGVGLILLLFAIFGGWAATARIDSAAIGHGVVAVEGERKTIQHIDGGSIARIQTREAATVSAGDVLLVLDASESDSTLHILKSRLVLAEAHAARLKAERDGAETIQFESGLLDETERSAVDAMADQRHQFAQRRDRYARLQDGYQRRLSELRARLEAKQAEYGSRIEELKIVREELTKLAELEKKGLISSDRLFSLRRSESSVLGRRSADLAAVAAIKEDIAGVELQILELDDKRSSAAEAELQQLQQQLVELRERVRSAEQVSARKTIVAPVSGTVINLKFHTPGGVIKSGEPILDIVPGSPSLVVNARVEPKDRDVIRSGLSAEIRFSAFSRRHTKPIGGTVVFVSADSIEDAATKVRYYLARVAIDPLPETSAFNIDDLHPGMQAEVMIVTGKRTVLEYLTEPFKRSLSRALKED